MANDPEGQLALHAIRCDGPMESNLRWLFVIPTAYAADLTSCTTPLSTRKEKIRPVSRKAIDTVSTVRYNYSVYCSEDSVLPTNYSVLLEQKSPYLERSELLKTGQKDQSAASIDISAEGRNSYAGTIGEPLSID